MALKRIRVKLFLPGNQKFVRKTFAAKPGHRLTEDGLDQILEFAVDQVEKLFPGHEYSMVQVGPRDFNFVWISEKAKAAA